MIQAHYSTTSASEGQLPNARLLSKVVSAIIEDIKPEVELDGVIHYIDDAEMRQLNKSYRRLDKVTDVLSFTYEAEGEERHGSFEVYIDIPQTIKQSKRYGVSFLNEFLRLLIHGTLHAYGFDHMKESDRSIMRSYEKKLLKKALSLVV